MNTLLSDSSPNNQIGFGTFVDKPLAPYVSVDPRRSVTLHLWMYFSCVFLLLRIADPCQGSFEPCLPTFDYKHLLSLTMNGTVFEVMHENI